MDQFFLPRGSIPEVAVCCYIADKSLFISDLRLELRAWKSALLFHNSTRRGGCPWSLMDARLLSLPRGCYRHEAGHRPDLRAVVAAVVQEQAGATDKHQRAGPAERTGGEGGIARIVHASAGINSTATCRCVYFTAFSHFHTSAMAGMTVPVKIKVWSCRDFGGAE